MKLRSFVPNQMQKSGVDGLDDLKYFGRRDPKWKALESRDGWTVVLARSIYTAFAMYSDDGELIGVMSINERRPVEVMAVRIQPPFIGRGLGKALYEVVLRKHRCLRSSTDLSKGSSKTWKYLVEKFNGRLGFSRGGRITYVDIVGWDLRQGFTYPILHTADGRGLSLFAALRSKDESEQNAAENSFYEIHI